MFKVYEYIYPSVDSQMVFDTVNILPNIVNGIPATNVTVFKNGDKDQILTFNIVTDLIDPTIKRLQLSEQLSINDYLVMYIAYNADFIVGDYGNVLYKRYGAGQRLMYNQEYTTNIDIEGVPVKLGFTSRYDPFYCPNKYVKEDISHLVTLSDESINFAIYDASLKVLYEISGGGDSTILPVTPFELSDMKSIPFNVQQNVRYRAEYDIMLAAYNILAGKSGRINKRLGDMQIEKEVRLPNIDDFLRGIKEKLNQYPLFTGSKMIRSVVKGIAVEPWPVSSPRRSF